MNNLQKQPSSLPLIIILIGTTILAVPAIIINYLFIEAANSKSSDAGNALTAALLCVTVFGFILFAGYILTAVFRRHNPVLWFFSMIFNLILCACYSLALSGSGEGLSPKFAGASPETLISVLPFWTFFVMLASGYYLFFGRFDKKSELV